ncbi:hypothetical protein F9C07_2160892 [Aspergillus flavus]|uniref:Uncharacterized protein n=1 Tax=Aspergillus flavus (strain ATCC 200026 / FGSC A1120 / IAM 13836 / NRRL 3357 / JCM 12722 / SRRC 167) TaxID=332952 RepID=A0A7U2R1M1_ASPFN|nr:uncharacterized protein G4B84_007394 [Aspergillus flavus NRRL3357]KAJ1704900.1 hypothetical protein NYO67_12945 [Aspergillus flavus]QMW32013.1 hypothetical protein G4B84_007394 [Aspergillus flavus NRRL3357]QRD91090.1 hypothetical protein F9C07_2160892 [Aspergillus flavus]
MPTESMILREIGFMQLSQGIFLQSLPIQGALVENSSLSHSRPAHSSPDVIIICAWGFAHAKHIAKYISGHQSLFPTAKILLIQNCVANIMWKSDYSQMQWFQPAATVLRECIDTKPDLKVLLHLFSNTGSHSAVQLAEACALNDPPFALPVTSIILDSCPSMPIFEPMANALALGVPSRNIVITIIARAVVYALVGFTLAIENTGLVTHAATKLYTQLNSTDNVFLTRGASTEDQTPISPIPRTYIYGPDDDMIPVDQVIQHANVAIENMSARGFDDASEYVTMEKFVGSPHVNHVKFEKERYWKIVKETWQRSVRKSIEKKLAVTIEDVQICSEEQLAG